MKPVDLRPEVRQIGVDSIELDFLVQGDGSNGALQTLGCMGIMVLCGMRRVCRYVLCTLGYTGVIFDELSERERVLK